VPVPTAVGAELALLLATMALALGKEILT